MRLTSRIKAGGMVLLSILVAVTMIAPPTAAASVLQPDLISEASSQPEVAATQPDALPEALAQTTLEVRILSTPWATLDSNDPTGSNGATPNVFVVQAEVTNTGAEAATNVSVLLNYFEDPASGWVLLPGETEERTIDELAPSESYHAYWFASYSTTIDSAHYYEVTTSADNADPVTTGDNSYGNPAPGMTVKTRSTTSTGSSGVTQTSANVTVGVAFTVQVTYDLGTNPIGVNFSPVGNTDFNASAYRLLSTSVRFYNDSGTQETTVSDRLYFPLADLPAFADNAEVTFTFIALVPEDVRLCSYAAVYYAPATYKYDQFYCSEKNNTVITIDGTLLMELEKNVSHTTIQQGETLDYTIVYTNSGDMGLIYAWVWDDINLSKGSIDDTSVSPDPDPLETSDSRVAWYLGDVEPAGSEGSTGALSFSMLVDGSGQDLADGVEIINHAYFGINEGVLPSLPALTATATTVVRAPVIELTKTDGRMTAEAGETLYYSLQITNTGSVGAAGLVITDTLPASVSYVNAAPAPDEINGQTLVWNNLPNVDPSGGTLSIDVEATIDGNVSIGTTLVNSVEVEYQNLVEYTYSPKFASDTTNVTGADLEIVKTDAPDPVPVGSTLTYILSYENIGPADAEEIVIVDTLPDEVIYGGVVSQPSYLAGPAVSGKTLTWQAASLAAGGGDSIIYTVTVSSGASDVITNSAVISSSTYDDNLLNDADNETTTVGTGALATIYGFVFDDANGNGVKDSGEEGIPGVTLTLDGTDTTQTNEVGIYSFLTGVEGDHSIVETDPAGYFSTTPNEVHLSVIIGESYQVNFGDAPSSSEFAAIFGTVFEDTDTDGIFDEDEMGIPGVTVTLDNAATAVTNPYGAYTFSIAVAGQHRVTETDPEGYLSTTPNEVVFDVALGTGYQADFGDMLACECAADTYEEDDSYGQAKMIQLGAAYSQSRNFCDDAEDWIAFTAERGTEYMVTTSSWGQRADTVLAIYDRDGMTMLVGNDDEEGSDDFSSVLHWRASGAGTYYLKVTNLSSLTCCSTEYDVSIEAGDSMDYVYMPLVMMSPEAAPTVAAPVSPTGVIMHMCPDEYEVDDSWELAVRIFDGVKQVHSFDSNPALYAADKDVVWFTIHEGDTVLFDTPSTTNVVPILELYNASGAALGVSGAEQLEWTAEVGGRYYLSVSTESMNFGCSDVAGYELLMDQITLPRVYLPLVTGLFGE